MAAAVSRSSKRRKLSPPTPGHGGVSSRNSVQSALFQNAPNWNLEQEYDTRSRKGARRQVEGKGLPIKTSDGLLREAEVVVEGSVSADNDSQWDEDHDGSAMDEPTTAPKVSPVSEREQVLIAKEDLASIATKLNENPEEHPGAFKALAEIGQSKQPAVKKLCLVTQMAVYRDVIPGYRIRPASEDATGEKLSREVRRIQAYEHALVSGYQAYVKDLSKLSKGDGGFHGSDVKGLADVAIACTCTLLNSVPHFNFRSDLLRILVGKLSKKGMDESFVKARQALHTLFREDEEGRPSMEAVSLLSKMMKARDYRIDESVLNLFLHLRLLGEFTGKASQDHVERPHVVVPKGKKPKEKREIRTKRERKMMKEQKALDKEMLQADASVSHEEREQMQSDTLKLVFATYFRVLKLRLPHLMGAVLEGLAKYAHLINQDFFGDLLEALKDLIRHSEADGEGEAEGGDEEDEAVDDDDDDDETNVGILRNPSREALLCTVTAFALLAGQDAHNARANLHLDLSFFTTHLFRSILSISLNPDVELGASALHLSNTDGSQMPAGNKVNLQTTTVLFVRCLTAVLLPPFNIRSVPPLRLAAFSKQLMSASLHLPEKSCQAMLALLNDVARAHGKKISALWNTEERKGDGTFNALSTTVEGSNPFTTTVWEGEILRKHFCPKVREGVKILQKTLTQ